MCHETIRNGFLIKFRWQDRKEHPNKSKNNEDMAERAKRPLSDGVRSFHNTLLLMGYAKKVKQHIFVY